MCRNTKLERISKAHRLELPFFFLSLVVFLCIVFIGPRTEAAESANNFFRDLTSVLHVEINRESGPTENAGALNHDRIFAKFLPSAPHTQLSLSDNLKLFYNMQRIRGDYYEQHDNSKKCAIFGIDISF